MTRIETVIVWPIVLVLGFWACLYLVMGIEWAWRLFFANPGQEAQKQKQELAEYEEAIAGNR